MSQLQKLERDQKFNVDEFNKNFEKTDLMTKQMEQQNIINKEIEPNIINKEIEQNIINKEIEQRKSENLIINIKNVFFEVLELLLDFKNPIPHILENEKKEFAFSIIILLSGILLLFLSNFLI